MDIFYHVCAIGRFEDIMKRQLSTLKKSGLLDKVDNVYVNIVGGNETRAQELCKNTTDKCVFSQGNNEIQEKSTLKKLQDHCTTNPSKRVLYIHSKGVTRSTIAPRIDDWSRLMEHFLITRYQRCQACLRRFDTCGVNFITTHISQPHYSGNFWWANASYINTLPDVINYRGGVSKRVSSEMWISSSPNGMRYKCFHNSGVNHYKKRYGANKYKNAPARHCKGVTFQKRQVLCR